MKAAHQRTLTAIFSNPTPTTLAWRQIESLLIALGAQVIEGRGSRVRFELSGVIATFHRPHPQKEAKPYQVRDVRDFLTQAGIEP
ncbi:MAG: type II toxin-antitoxin system HicA family toxin [Chloroflexi bacterium]|nr:type II toxin-antitoxin system HicA family toxin [Chloroflexota bacterium]